MISPEICGLIILIVLFYQTLDASSNVHLLEVLSSIARFHRSPPSYSRNQLVTHTVAVDVPYPAVHLSDFFNYFRRNIGRYSNTSLDATTSVATMQQAWLAAPSWIAMFKTQRDAARQYSYASSDFLKNVDSSEEIDEKSHATIYLTSRNGMFGNIDISSFEANLSSASVASELRKTRYTYAVVVSLLSDFELDLDSPWPANVAQPPTVSVLSSNTIAMDIFSSLTSFASKALNLNIGIRHEGMLSTVNSAVPSVASTPKRSSSISSRTTASAVRQRVTAVPTAAYHLAALLCGVDRQLPMSPAPVHMPSSESRSAASSPHRLLPRGTPIPSHLAASLNASTDLTLERTLFESIGQRKLNSNNNVAAMHTQYQIATEFHAQKSSASAETVPADSSSWSRDQLQLRYSLLRVDTENIYPYTESHATNSIGRSAQRANANINRSWESLQAIMYQQVVPELHRALERMVARALIDYQRDSVWQNLVLSDSKRGSQHLWYTAFYNYLWCTASYDNQMFHWLKLAIKKKHSAV